jgi:hypothetical protein
VQFRASLGNHDEIDQTRYPLFGMEGQRYYTFSPAGSDVRFFALDSVMPDPGQIAWLERELRRSTESWKVAYFHHPIYSSGARHGSDEDLRALFEPVFLELGIDVVFAGHDHFYERIKPQKGIAHFVIGSGGKLAAGDLEKNSPLTARGFDTDYAFLAGEVVADQMYFNGITRTGGIMDSGIIGRRTDSAGSSAPAVK